MRPVPVAAPAAAGLALALVLAGALGCASTPGERPADVAPPDGSSASDPGPTPDASSCERVERIVVRRTERLLIATCAGGAERRIPVALARGTGSKRRSGDQSLPEGDYQVAGPARPSRFHRFLPIDYPAPADAARALADGTISREDHDAIVAAHAQGRLPPQQTPLGGHLGFHGEGRRWRGELALDWTEGCVAMTDSDIEWLGARSPPGTPVRIEP